MDQIARLLSKEGREECALCAYFIVISLIVGAISVSTFIVKFLSFVYRHTLKRARNFNQTYNQGNSWAVITGGSDGIGEQFARDLVAQGFNICIISRNEEKIKSKLRLIEEIAPKNKKILTRCVVADLAASTKYSDYEKIAEQLKDIDIGILILNAGQSLMGPFKDLTPQEIEQQVTINALHPAYLSKALISQMYARTKRSAIIITSSGLGSTAVPGILAYSMSKSFSSYLGQGLNWELKDKIDVISFECGEVKTKLLGNRKGPMVITADRATSGCLRDVGSYGLTYGAFIHELALRLLPKYVMKLAINAASAKVLRLYRAKQDRERVKAD